MHKVDGDVAQSKGAGFDPQYHKRKNEGNLSKSPILYTINNYRFYLSEINND